MPTKTSYSSPLTFQPTLGSPEESENILKEAAESVTINNVSSAASTAGKLAGKINPVTGVLMGAQLATTGIKEGMQSVDALKQADPSASKGQRVGAALGGFGLGVANQLLGTDFQFKNKAIKDYEKNMEAFMAEKSSLTMKEKPLKMLSGVKAPITYKMSAAQYKSGLKMQEISGAAPLQANAFYASLNAAKEAGRDTFEVDGKTFDVK